MRSACAASKDYLAALEGFPGLVPEGAGFDLIQGGLGYRLTRLRDWLRGSVPAEANETGRSESKAGRDSL